MKGAQHHCLVNAAGKALSILSSQHCILGFYFQHGLNISVTSGSKELREDKTSSQSVHFVGQGGKIINNRNAKCLHDSETLETLSQWAYLEAAFCNKGTNKDFLEAVGINSRGIFKLNDFICLKIFFCLFCLNAYLCPRRPSNPLVLELYQLWAI